MDSNRLVVVTGVTRGCGRALAVWLAARGHRVVGCGRSRDRLESLGGELRRACSVVDVADDPQVARWAAETLATHGAPDLLLNNAALMNAPAPLWEVPAEEFSRVIDVNLKGTAAVIRHFAPAMIARGRGVIVNFSSGWGRSTSPEVAPYCATKFAIEGLTRSLAQELPSGLAAVALNPGIINTEMLRTSWPTGASAHESPERWVERAGPYLLALGPKDNGKSLSVP